MGAVAGAVELGLFPGFGAVGVRCVGGGGLVFGFYWSLGIDLSSSVCRILAVLGPGSDLSFVALAIVFAGIRRVILGVRGVSFVERSVAAGFLYE